MLKLLIKLFKKIIFSVFLVYGLNLLTSPMGIIIPINVYTISIITILGIPSLVFLIVILILIF